MQTLLRRSLLTLGLIATFGAPAAAADGPPPPDWRVGAYVGGASDLLFMSAGGLGGLASFGAAQVGGGFERRLAGDLWLLADLQGGWQRSEASGGAASEAWNLMAVAGLRYVLNPGDLVAVSVAGRIGAGGGAAESCAIDADTSARTCTSGDSVQVAGTLELAAAIALTDGLDLRVAGTFFEARWARTESDDSGDWSEQTRVSAVFRPSIGLFAAF